MFFSCHLIALSNGINYIEIEKWLLELKRKKYLLSENVMYTIVHEHAASIYSSSPEAKEELPSLDPEMITAGWCEILLKNPKSYKTSVFNLIEQHLLDIFNIIFSYTQNCIDV